jgi:tRNA(His) 5'-end guanylyltransferase
MKYNNKNSIGGRMKQNYEEIFKYKLPERMPVIIRLDGRAFHTLTKKAEKPFDSVFITLMDNTVKYLCKNIDTCQLAYIQSDEISLLLHNYKRLNTQSWFNNEIQKICSISAGMASSYFTIKYNDNFNSEMIATRDGYVQPNNIYIQFDSRCFVLPEAEVCNYFIWRQKDWERNSIQMLAQSLYSHKELHKKNNSELQEMCFQKGKNWNDLRMDLKRGRCVKKNEDGEWFVDNEISIFTQDRNYIEKYLETEEG